LSYSDAFKDHLTNPRNVGELSGASVVVEESNPVCGDRLRLSLLLDEGKIREVRYLAYGCPPTLVCGSVLTEMVLGMTLEAARELTRDALIEKVGGLPSRKHHAAALAIETLRTALRQ